MTDLHWGLPDPDTQPEFYNDVPVKRLIAFVIDMVLILVLTILVVPFTAFTGLFFFPFLMMLVGFAYRVVTLAAGSATLGMRLTSIEFRSGDGQRLSLFQAFLHTLTFSIAFSMVVPQVISVVLMLSLPRGQGLPDMVLGCAAINRPGRLSR